MAFTLGDLLLQWQQYQVFDYLLPFLLIFAVVFGILSATNILGKNKGIHIIIAFVVGLLALQLPFLPEFFSQIFPRLGVAVAVILSLLILVGLFIPDQERRYWFYGLGAIGFISALVVISQSFSAIGFFSFGGFTSEYVGWIVAGVLIIGLIIAIAASGSDGPSNPNAGTASFNPMR